MRSSLGAEPLGVLDGGGPAGGLPVSVTVGAGELGWFSPWLMTRSTAMMIASAPSTPAAQSSARWPDEKVRRAGGGR